MLVLDSCSSIQANATTNLCISIASYIHLLQVGILAAMLLLVLCLSIETTYTKPLI